MPILAAEDYRYDEDGDDWTPALLRAQRALQNGGEITLFQHEEYTFRSELPIIRRVTIRGTDVGPSAEAGTRLRFIGCPGVRVVFPGDPIYPDAQGGFCALERLVLIYEGNLTDQVDHHGILVQRTCSLTHVFVTGFPGDGVRVQDDMRKEPRTVANLCAFYRVGSHSNGRCGFYFQGGNAGTGTIIACDASQNGLRDLPDANHGFYDDSQNGNYFFGCHAASNTGRNYKCTNGRAGSVVVACYSADRPDGIGSDEVTYPNFSVFGTLTPAPGARVDGLRRHNPMRLTDFHAGGIEVDGVETVEARFARHGTTELMHFWSKGDPQGYKFQLVAGEGPLRDTWAWMHQGVATYSPLAFTKPDHERNRGHAIAHRGILTGSAHVRLGSGEAPPAASQAEEVWQRGDRWFVSPPPASGEPLEYVCTERAEDGALTWVATVWMP